MTGPTPVVARASTIHPCPICGHGSKGCSVTEDGLHFCRGEVADPGAWRCVKPGDPFNCYRPAEDDRHERNGQPPRKRDWSAEAGRFAHNLTPERRAELVALLRLPAAALDTAHGVGFTPHGVKDTAGQWVAAWTFPVCDGRGNVVGIQKRYPVPVNGSNKAYAAGSVTGLFLTAGWVDRPGPVLLPEGASDTLALSVCGLPAVGRPSNTAGIGYLAELLRPIDPAREIIVVGENDQKPDGRWPGKDGAERVAAELGAKLGRVVRVALPPLGYKDCRVWVIDLVAGQGESADWPAVGAELARHLSADPTRFAFIDSAKFFATNYTLEFHIPRVLARGQPAVIGGPSKTLKTSVVIDMAVSMATATPFLGTFAVPKRSRVAVASAESGAFNLKETALRVLRARELDPSALSGWAKWEFTLPTFSDAVAMAEFARRLAALEVDVVFIDPLYLALGDVDAKSLFEMGRALQPVAERLLNKNVTPVIVHHANKQLPAGEAMGLEHLSYAGLAEFARQWLLINRQSAYRGDGVHDLWMNVGGSAGHGGLWSLHVEEGIADEHARGRRWDVAVQTAGQTWADQIDRKQEARKEAARKRNLEAEVAVLEAIDAAPDQTATRKRIGSHTGFGRDKVKDVLDGLIEAGAVREVEFAVTIAHGAKKDATGYRRAGG